MRKSISRVLALVLLALVLALLIAPSMARADEQPLPVVEVADGVFVHQAPYVLARPRNEGAIANAGFIVGRDGVMVIDTEGSAVAGRRLLAAVRARTALPIRYVVNTHVHPDHLLGNSAFAAPGTIFVGHHRLPEALAARGARYLAATEDLIGADAFAGTRLVAPTLLVHGTLDLDLGGRGLRLQAWPTAHTDADLTVFDEATATWFLGDLLFAGHAPALDGSLDGWLKVLDTMKAQPAARVVPGHGPASMPWPAAAAPLEGYLASLRGELRAMIAEGQTMQEAVARAGRDQAGRWALFDDFNARNATTAYHELEWE